MKDEEEIADYREQAIAKMKEADRLEASARAARADAQFLSKAADRFRMEANAQIPVDRTAITLTDGSPVTEDHRELKENGQQKGYVVLSAEERAKGFVRPLRHSYIHRGIRPTYPTRELTPEEHQRYDQYAYVLYEEYPEGAGIGLGRYWTQEQLNSGCGTSTRMSDAIAETYARDPEFYGGTFCCHCGRHFPVEQFVWEGTDERVGS